MPEEKKAWGEAAEGEDDDIPELPPRYETEVDMNGVKTVTTYRTSGVGQKVRTVQTVKVSKKTVRVSKAVLARRSWAKFGLEKGKPSGYHGRGFVDGGTTGLDGNEQILDMAPKARAAEENNESAQRAFDKMNVGSFQAWVPKNRDAGASIGAAKEWAEANGLIRNDDDGGPTLGPPTGGGGGGSSLAALAAGAANRSSYVPPSMRNADGSRNTELAGQRDDSCTVRVSNLSEEVKDSDLRELFRRFGPIQRIYLAKDRDTHQSRGFAFVNFFNKDDAAQAIEKLDGHGYDHLIISVSWANPSSNDGGGGGGGGGASRGDQYNSGDARKTHTDPRHEQHVFNPNLDRFR